MDEVFQDRLWEPFSFVKPVSTATSQPVSTVRATNGRARRIGGVMDGVVVILLGVVVGLVVIVTIVVARVPGPERRARIEVVRAGYRLRRARRAHERLVADAEREVARVERHHSTQLAELDRTIVALEDPRGPRIDALGPVTLFALRLVTPAGEVPIDGVEADVDTEGSLRVHRRTTLTRLAVGGAVLGPLGAVLALGFPKRRTVDGRELYLLLEAGPASCVVQVDPDAGPQVRAFAVQVNAAAAGARQRRERIATELTAVRARLAAMREDHTALDAARDALAAAREDPATSSAIAAAERELATAHAALAALGR